MIDPHYRLTTAELIDICQFGDAVALVYLYFSTRSGRSGECWPSISTIAADLNMDRRRVMRAIRILQEQGRLEIVSDSGCVNTYRIISNQCQKRTRGSVKNVPGNQCQKRTDTRRIFDTGPVTKTDYEPVSRTNTKNQKVVFPESPDTDSFKTSWSEWEQFRIEAHKKLTDSTRRKQLAKLARWGSTKAVLAIETSIEKGWMGLFEPNGNANGHAQPVAQGIKDPHEATQDELDELLAGRNA